MTFVAKLAPTEMDRLDAAVRGAGFDFKDIAHARFSARGLGVVCTLYESGKVVVQGKGTEAFVAHYLPSHLAAEDAKAKDAGLDAVVVGSDESGKGDYFGPLVVAAVAMGPREAEYLGDVRLVDSKTLKGRAISETAARIRDTVPYHVVSILPRRYNELYEQIGNLNHLLAWAHGQALENVLEDCGDIGPVERVVVDKFCEEPVLRRRFKERTKALPLELRARAESNPAVAAASILATDAFTRGLRFLGREADIELPKGASAKVDATARRLVRAKGFEALHGLAKLHFKTTERVRHG